MSGGALPRLSGPRVRPDQTSRDQVRNFLLYAGISVLAFLIGVASTEVSPVFILGAVLVPMAILAILRWPYVGLILYTIIYFTQIADLYPALKPLRPERVIGVMTLAAMFLKQLREEGRLYVDRSKITIWLVLVVAAVLNSIPLSYWPGRSLAAMIEYMKIVIFYLLVVQLVNTKPRLRVFMWLFMGCITYIALDGIINFATGGAKMHADGVMRLQGSTDVSGGSNGIAATMAAALPLYLTVARGKTIGVMRWVLVAAAALTVVVVLLSGSRSGLIGFVAGAGLTWFVLPKRWLILAATIPFLFVVWAALPAEHQARFSTLGQASEEGTAKSRMELWHKGMLMFVDRPLNGVGIGAFPIANSVYSEKTGLDAEPFHESHSLYVEVASALGVPGVVALFMFFGTYLLSMHRSRRQMGDDPDWEFESNVIAGMMLSSAALLVAGIFGHNMMRRNWYIYAAVAVATYRVLTTWHAARSVRD